jgi:hypothetical protein
MAGNWMQFETYQHSFDTDVQAAIIMGVLVC